jgi:hypothetical protein
VEAEDQQTLIQETLADLEEVDGETQEEVETNHQ